MDASDLLRGVKIVPVIEIDDSATAVPLAEKLLECGLGAIEVTLRTAAGLKAIEAIASRVPEMLVGAGSVRLVDQIADVQSAGARFAVCPGSTPKLLVTAREANLPFIPGAVTASEILNLFELGYKLQKFFPAELAGGVRYIKAVGAPLPEVSFMPTGGITSDNAAQYLALENVACLGGSWIVPRELLRLSDFEAIAQLVGNAVGLVRR